MRDGLSRMSLRLVNCKLVSKMYLHWTPSTRIVRGHVIRGYSGEVSCSGYIVQLLLHSLSRHLWRVGFVVLKLELNDHCLVLRAPTELSDKLLM